MLKRFAILAALIASPAAGGETGVETWVISGQSNACGRGKLPGAPASARVSMFDFKTSRWVPAKEPLPMLNGTVGPWQAAALEAVRLGGPSIRLTGYASGGKPIASWHKGGAGWTKLTAAIAKSGKGAGAFLWYQGENGAVRKMKAATYLAELKKLVSRVRAEAGNPKMTAVIVQLGAWGSKRPADFMAVREAQRRFVVSDGNALLVPALGRRMKDHVHLSREGYFELGAGIGRALSAKRHGNRKVDWPGPVLDAAVAAADGKSVTAHFAEAKRLGGVKAGDFGAVDAGGPAKCTAADARGTLVGLTFERKLKLPARLIYGFGNNPGATLVDEAGNRAPAVQLRIAKGALPADKFTTAPNGAGPSSSFKDVPDGSYTGSARGYVADVKVRVTVAGGRMTGVKVLKHRENRPLSAISRVPARIVAAQRIKVDAVTGATITSRAIMKATEKALKAAPKK